MVPHVVFAADDQVRTQPLPALASMTGAGKQTWEGWWRFPGEPEPEVPPHGTLTFDPEEGARLRLVHAGPHDPFRDPEPRREAIHGWTVQRRQVSLLDALLDGVEGTVGGGAIEHWHGQVVIDGEIVDRLTDFTFARKSFWGNPSLRFGSRKRFLRGTARLLGEPRRISGEP